MEYLVKQKNSEVFRTLLTEKHVPFVQKENSEAVILPFNEEGRDRVIRIVALYIMSHSFEETLEELNGKEIFKDVDEEMQQVIVQDVVQSFFQNSYFFDVTYLKVANYFASNDAIHVESFERFNMRGFKDDIESLVSEILHAHSMTKFQEEMDKQFEQARKRAMEAGLDVSKYSKLTVNIEEEDGVNFHTIHIVHDETSEQILVDDTFLETYLNGESYFQLSLEYKPLEEDFKSLMTVLKLLPVNQIIISDEVTVDVVELISLIVNMVEGEIDIVFGEK